MPNETLVSPDNLKLIIQSVGTLQKGAECACDTPDLRRVFGHAPLGRVMVLDVIAGNKATLIIWN